MSSVVDAFHPLQTHFLALFRRTFQTHFTDVLDARTHFTPACKRNTITTLDLRLGCDSSKCQSMKLALNRKRKRLRKCTNLIREDELFIENKTKIASGVGYSERAAFKNTLIKRIKYVKNYFHFNVYLIYLFTRCQRISIDEKYRK